MSQQELANELGTSRQYINDVVNQRYEQVSLQTAKNIAGILGCSIEELYEWIPKKGD